MLINLNSQDNGIEMRPTVVRIMEQYQIKLNLCYTYSSYS